MTTDVGKLVTLHHRRRGWAWVAAGSAIGLLVYLGIGLNLSGNLTGTAETLSVIPVFVLLALVAAGLVVVVLDTSRIHRADAAVRASAKRSVSHHPVYAHAHRYPPHHRGSWVFVIFTLAVLTSINAFFLPTEVDSWAYVLGAGNQDTFHPVSYGQACSGGPRRGGCHIVTEGYLSNSRAGVNWNSQVPLGQPFRVRDPLWAWGTGRTLTSGDGSAIPTIIGGLFFVGVTLLLLYALLVVVRRTPATRGRRMSAPAGAHPVAVRVARPPDRGHHGSSASRRARRGRGRR
jgi:hypothetical protein